MENCIDTIIFKTPFTCLIAGPTQSGKTTLLENILLKMNTIANPAISKIIYCYARWQDKYDVLSKNLNNIEFNEGLYDIDLINPSDKVLLILDDLTHLCEKDEAILNLFTTDSHQKNISVFLLCQNIFSRGKYFRTISLNSHYIIIMNNPRDRL